MSLAAADFSQIPMSQNLGTTLARASDVANAFGAAEVALEHMLLALCDDPDAEAVLMASRVDVQHLKAETHGYLNSLPRQESGPGFGVSQALSRILEAAAAAARGSRRRDINGAIVLAAIVGEGRSAAAQILQVHGLTFDEAIRALQAALATPPRDTLPVIRPAEDVLARARERVQSRAAPGLREMLPRPVQPQPPPPPQMAPAPAPAPEPILPTLPDAPSAEIVVPDSAGHGAAEAHDSAVADAQKEAASGADGVPNAASPELPPATETPERIEPTLPVGEPNAEPLPMPASARPEPPMTAGHRPAQATDFGFPAAPPPAPSPPRAPEPAPQFPYDLQRPQPIAVPPPIPPMLPPSAPGYPSGGIPPGFGAPPPPYAPQQPAPPFQRGPAPPPTMRGDAYGLPPAPHDPSRPPLPGGPLGGPYGNPGSAAAPSARDMHMPMPSAPPPGQPPPQRASRAKIETGQLSENIPRAMRVGKTEAVEVRIGKATAKAITQGLEGGGVAWRHDVTVTQAMSVRLRAPEGGFFIETASPETQWIENNLGLGSDDFASWRFHITPQDRGWSRIQIIVSARTIGNDGMAAETALPDQLVDVKVRTNYKRTFARWTGWTLAAIVGGFLAKFGEGAWAALAPLVEKFLK